MAASVREGIRSREKATTPANPPAGSRYLYPKTDGWYELSSSGVETKVTNVASSGSGGITPRATSTATTAAANELIVANAASAGFTVTLPAHSSGIQVWVKKVDSTANVVTVSSPAGLIDGASTATLDVQYEALTIISDGTNWHIF